MKKIFYFLFALTVPLFVSAQPIDKRIGYDLNHDRILYTIGYAHLDTEWNWDYSTTINSYIKNIMEENLRLFDQFPDYVFNFTGSRRYHMMKEYYPDLYRKVVEKIKEGRWYVAGSSVDEGEVNISSPESIVRQVLYGNDYFRKEFGVESHDYMLPDCFGFPANMPTIWNYCGLVGFSTQKLTWHSAAGIPFNIGIWKGVDGKGVVAALNATDYGGSVVSHLDKNDYWNNRISENQKKYGIAFDYRYYGVGDRGGAPYKDDVRHAVESARSQNGKIKVILTSSDQMYRDITPEIRAKLPVYTGDLLLTEHSAGSLTSQAYMKRMNRKNEILAQSAEQLAAIANWMGEVYPQKKLNDSWELVLGSQFHDILPGTSIPKAYEYAWNDEFVAANGFAEVLKHSLGVITHNMNTRGQGRSVVVYNPVAMERQDVVTAELNYDVVPLEVTVFDKDGHALPTQIVSKEGNKLKIIFLACVPSLGLAVFDVRSCSPEKINSFLKVTESSLENAYYKILFASDGDIVSIYDKKEDRELLSGPARLEFMREHPSAYPAWNMDWKDRQNPAFDFMNKEASIHILENGPVRIALGINRKGQGSEINQVVSLSAGEAGKRIEVSNRLNWQSSGVSLKASFPLTVCNDSATYNLGVGTIRRSTNNEKKYEVPSREWFDLTDRSGIYGVSVLEDCKYGSDKPDNKTLRLTLLYTPQAEGRYVYQNSQDFGVHDFRYGIYGHVGDSNKGLSAWQGAFFNKSLIAAEVPVHAGKGGKVLSLLKVSTPEMGVMAFKKAENSEGYIVRVNELFGNDLKGAKLIFPQIISEAYEVNGQEQRIGEVAWHENRISFDLPHNSVRSFAVKLKMRNHSTVVQNQRAISLPYNQDIMSTDDNRADGMFAQYMSIPAELVPDEIESEGIRFKIGGRGDEEKNAVVCKGQQIDLPSGNYDRLYLLAAADNDVTDSLYVDGQVKPLSVQAWTGYVGQFYNRVFNSDKSNVTEVLPPYSKQDNIAWFASHRHIEYPSANDAYQYCYLYKYMFFIPKGAQKLVLPKSSKIKIVAITVADSHCDEVKMLQPLYDNFQNYSKFVLNKL